METQRQEFRIGIMVLTAIVCLVLMTVFFGGQQMMNFGGNSNSIQVRFLRAPGINQNSPVYKNGIRIGRVSRVELVEQDQQVEVTISLYRQRKIYTDEECRVKQNMIMGDASLEFGKRSNYTGKREEIVPGAIPYLIGESSSDLMSGFGNLEGDLTKALQHVSNAAEQLGIFIDRVNTSLGSPEDFSLQQAKFSAVVDETRQTMASLRQATTGISNIVNDPAVQENIRKVVSDLPDVIEHSRTLVSESTLFVRETRGLIEKGNLSLDNLSAGLEKVSRTLDVITKIANQVEGDVPEIVTAVKRSAVQLESLFSELTLIVENFRNADGTVKRLIRDPEAYEKLMATLDNVEKITDDVAWILAVDAKPIAHNVKIFTDKMARDPSIFIRNLLRKEPPIKNLPYSFGGGMVATSFYPPTTVIDGEVVEILEEMPVQMSRIPKMNVARHAPPANSIHYEAVIPPPSGGRIINDDPRYPDF